MVDKLDRPCYIIITIRRAAMIRTIYFYNKKHEAHDLGAYKGRLSAIGVENWCYRIARQLGVDRKDIIIEEISG